MLKLTEIVKLKDQGCYKQAIDIGLKIDPKNIDKPEKFYAELTHVCILDGKLEQATIFLNKAQQIAELDFDVRLNSARLSLVTSELTKAKVIVDDLLSEFVGRVEIQTLLASYYRNNGELQKSFELCNKILETHQENVEALINVGIIQYLTNKTDEAYGALKKSYELNPNIKSLWKLLSSLAVIQCDYGFAINILYRLKNSDALDQKSLHMLARCLIETKQYEEGLTVLRQLIETDPANALYFNDLGIILHQQGNFTASKANFQRAIELQDTFPQALNNLGTLLLDEKAPMQARELFQRAIKIEPNYADAYNNLGKAFVNLGEIGSGIENYRKALKINETKKDTLISLLTLLVQIKDSEETDIFTEFQSLKSFKSGIEENLELLTLQSIDYFLRKDLANLKATLENFKLSWDVKKELLHPKQKIFCSAYTNFIEKLIGAYTTFYKSDLQKIICIGDSHTLTFSNSIKRIGSMDYRFQSRLVIGVKSYHLSQNAANSYKAIISEIVQNLRGSSKVIISVGEIDCRHDEGFLPHAIKNKADLNELINTSVAGLVRWLKCNIFEKHDLYVTNVPAPWFNKELTEATNNSVAIVRRKYNNALHEKLKETDIKIVDFYSKTVGLDGFAKPNYYLDGVHMHPNILLEMDFER